MIYVDNLWNMKCFPSEEPQKVAKTNQGKKSRQNQIEPANEHVEVSKLVKICKQTKTDLS